MAEENHLVPDQEVVDSHVSNLTSFSLTQKRRYDLEHERRKAHNQLKSARGKKGADTAAIEKRIVDIDSEIETSKARETAIASVLVSSARRSEPAEATQESSLDMAYKILMAIGVPMLLIFLGATFTRTWALKDGISEAKETMHSQHTDVASRLTALETTTGDLGKLIEKQVNAAVSSFESSQQSILESTNNANDARRKLVEANITSAMDKRFSSIDGKISKIEGTLSAMTKVIREVRDNQKTANIEKADSVFAME